MKNVLSSFAEGQLSREQMREVVGGKEQIIYNIYCAYKGSSTYTLIAQATSQMDAYRAGNQIYQQGGYSSCVYSSPG